MYENEDIEEISDEYLQVIPAEMLEMNNHSQNGSYELPTEYFGPEDLKEDLQNLVWEYRDRFRRSLSPSPANLQSFKLEVDVSLWEINEN